MSSNESIIICKNCRQKIKADKMFLHEGFCKRNNVFCEHCERVYLKEDYAKHKLEITKKLKDKQKDSPMDIIKSNNQNNNSCINKINLRINKPILEFEQAPSQEQFHINNPIIISPNGNIISKKNENEYLLPYLGYNNLNNNIPRNNDDVLLNEEKKINDGNIDYENFFFNNENNEQLIKNDNINNMNINKKLNDNECYSQNSGFIEQKKDRIINIIQRDEQSNNTKNNIMDLKNNQKINKIYEKDKKIRINNLIKKNKNNNNFIYDSKNNVNLINDVFNEQNKVINTNINITNINESKYKINTYFNPIRKAKLNNFKNYRKKKTPDIIINKSADCEFKEPSDNTLKKKFKNQIIYLHENNSPNKNEPNISSEKENYYNSKICKYCNNYIFDINLHYKKCLKRNEHRNKSNDFLLIKKDKSEQIINNNIFTEIKSNNYVNRDNKDDIKIKLYYSNQNDKIENNNENNANRINCLNAKNTDFRNYKKRKIYIINKGNKKNKNSNNNDNDNEIKNKIQNFEDNISSNNIDPLFFVGKSIQKKKNLDKGIPIKNNNEKEYSNNADSSIHFVL